MSLTTRISAQTAATPANAAATDPRTALVTSLWRLVQAFNEAESDLLREQIPAMTALLQLPESVSAAGVAESQEVQAELEQFAREAIDKLIIERLVANRRSVPLLRLSNADWIIVQIMRGGTVNDEVLAGTALLRPILERRINGEISSLTTFNPDLYQAFWLLAGAIMKQTESGLAPYELIKLPGARAEIYRQLISLEDWHKLGVRMVALVSGVNVTTTMGGLTALTGDEDVALFEEKLREGDAVIAPAIKSIAKFIRAFFTTRGQQIWGTKN